MIRSWLITSTTYGTWLPGDSRGFVSTVRDYRPDDTEPAATGVRTRHNDPGTPIDRDVVGLRRSAVSLLKSEPIYLIADQAAVVLAQFRETATYRRWTLHAGAVMANHFHVVVSALDTTPAAYVLRDFKSYAGRALNLKFGKPKAGTWWTESGSRRPLPDEGAVRDAAEYVANQYRPLAVWVSDS